MYGLGETWEAGVPRSSSCMEKAADPSYYSGHYCEKDNLRIPISVELSIGSATILTHYHNC